MEEFSGRHDSSVGILVEICQLFLIRLIIIIIIIAISWWENQRERDH
jgi:hypothetical protein